MAQFNLFSIILPNILKSTENNLCCPLFMLNKIKDTNVCVYVDTLQR